MIMAPADIVRVEDLSPDIRGDVAARVAVPESAAAASVAGPGGSQPAQPPGGTLREFKDASERAYLVQKLRENSWNISKTAEIIDTPRSNLYKKLEQYGIKQEVDG
jgi:two-component system nitrogen regulation response regulator NtrX